MLTGLAGEGTQFLGEAVHNRLRVASSAALQQRQESPFFKFLAAFVDRFDHAIGKDDEQISVAQCRAAASIRKFALDAKRNAALVKALQRS